MRLLTLNNSTIAVKNFPDYRKVPPYSILSHTWEEDEISFKDINSLSSEDLKGKRGYKKIRLCCIQAKKDGCDYSWVDTCCINKDDPSELSEAIGSMYKWYAKAKVCYAYLSDVSRQPIENDSRLEKERYLNVLRQSRWFTRGWTLQELIAPKVVRFYDTNWRLLGGKDNMTGIISDITLIHSDILTGSRKPEDFSVAARMAWAGNRATSKEEDIAYCLMGILNVRIPLMYGEGHEAFIRLQKEIINTLDDDSVLAWNPDVGNPELIDTQQDYSSLGIFAKHPSFFSRSANLRHSGSNLKPWQMTRRGLQLCESRWKNIRPQVWNLHLECYALREDGKRQCITVPVEPVIVSTTRENEPVVVFRRRPQRIFPTIGSQPFPRLTHNSPVYLSLEDTPSRLGISRPLWITFPTHVLQTFGLSANQLSLNKIFKVDIDNQLNEMSVGSEQMTIGIDRTHDVSFLLDYSAENIQDSADFKHDRCVAFTVAISSNDQWNKWSITSWKLKSQTKDGHFPPITASSKLVASFGDWKAFLNDQAVVNHCVEQWQIQNKTIQCSLNLSEKDEGVIALTIEHTLLKGTCMLKPRGYLHSLGFYGSCFGLFLCFGIFFSFECLAFVFTHPSSIE
jgi:hypothetical protein